MSPKFPSAKATLSYPLYAVDFDPEDSDYLLVGGGGGEGRSGVGNKITLLDTSSPNTVAELVDIELSRDEDSVTSLAVSHRLAEGTVQALAGINSSTSAQQAGINEHLRTFTVTYAAKGEESSVKGSSEKKSLAPGSIIPVSRASLFAPSTSAKKETYQRVLRSAPIRKRGTKSRVAAVATGLAAEGEIVLFKPDSSDAPERIALGRGQEAADVDIIESTDGGCYVAYCTDFDVSIYKVFQTTKATKGSSPASNPRCVYITPHPDVFASTRARPTFRAMRFLTPNHLLLLSNRPARSGAEVSVIQFGNGLGDVVQKKTLHSSLKAATSLDLAILDDGRAGDKQFVIAIAGQDISLELLTLDFNSSRGLGKLRTYTVLWDVHPLQMTKIAFSNFIPPTEKGTTSSQSPQQIKLASVSMGNTVAVHTLPLTSLTSSTGWSRYVLQSPGTTSRSIVSVLSTVIATILIAILFQVYLEVKLGNKQFPSVVQTFPSPVQSWLGGRGTEAPVATTSPSLQSEPVASIPSSIAKPATTASDHAAPASPTPVLGHPPGATLDDGHRVIIRHSPEQDALEVSSHLEEHLEAEPETKRWEDMTDDEKTHWKEALTDAGHWVEEQGESILKGVFFGGLGGLVGAAVGG